MVLSSALDNGYVFMALIAILTSVVSAYYYLAIVKQIFFHKTDYILNPVLENITLKASILNKVNNNYLQVPAREIILFFILIPQE